MVKFALTDFYASAVLAAPQRAMLALLVVPSRKNILHHFILKRAYYVRRFH